MKTHMHRITHSIESSQDYVGASASSSSHAAARSVRVRGVVADRVAHLNHHAVVVHFETGAGVRVGVAVLESQERELRGHPRDVDGAPCHLAGNGCAGAVDEEVREAVAGLLTTNARPPDLRQAVLE